MSFSADIRNFSQRQKDNYEKIRRESIIALFDMVVLGSPVDTGRFRGNWQCTIDHGATGTLQDIVPAQEVRNRIQKTVNGSEAVHAVYLTNNLEYAEALEYGHSAQAPNGMLRLATGYWNQIVQTQAARYR